MSDSLAQPIEAMSMMDHLRELRMRLVRSVLAIGLSTLVLLAFYDQLKNENYAGITNFNNFNSFKI